MGSCCSSKIHPEKHKISPQLLLENNNPRNINFINEKIVEKQVVDQGKSEIMIVSKLSKKEKNFNNYHKNVNGQTIIRKINEIKGEQVIFDSCSDSTFIMLDCVAQVTIEKCLNCNFYIGPCKSNISLRNSSNINMISLSQQLLCRNIENSNLSIFVMTNPTFEECNNLKLCCYFFDHFIEFKGKQFLIIELFISSGLCAWENKWSEYNVFSLNSTVDLISGQIEEFFQTLFTKYNEISLNKYDQKYIPFTYGLSFDYINQQNFLYFIDANEDCDDLLRLLDKNNLEKEECYLIKTCFLDKLENANLLDELVFNFKNQEFENLIKGIFLIYKLKGKKIFVVG